MTAEQKHILVVDDDPQFLALAKLMLDRAGFLVSIASLPDEALELLTTLEDQPNLVLTDIRMPNLTGFQLAAKLRDSNFSGQIALVTADNSLTTKQQAQDANLPLIVKPIFPTQITNQINSIINQKSE